MKTDLNKTESKEKIELLFQKQSFSPDEMKKIKRLAMKFRISLKPYKSLFCKSCLSKLSGNIRVSKTHKTIICSKCNYLNKIKLTG